MISKMKIIRPSTEILTSVSELELLRLVELAGRTCYKSEENVTEESYKKFTKMIIDNGHESVMEHSSLTIKFICDRGVSHELVRHRIASFSQESTRYCNYSTNKFDNQVTVILPPWVSEEDYTSMKELNEEGFGKMDKASRIWYTQCLTACSNYLLLLETGWRPEQARSVLPMSLKTEVVVTANLREWRLIFKQRTSKKAHPQMRELMIPLLGDLKTLLPIVFDDIVPQ